ncbi:MAG: hypothetical protein IPK05_18225 [Comamonadaceae bacterium]|nr:hypothetical protein [Comamonadaceae bacterium]
MDVATFAGFDAVARPDRLAALDGTDDIIRTHQLRLPDEQGDLADDLRASLAAAMSGVIKPTPSRKQARR